MTQPPFAGNDRFNQQGPSGQAGNHGQGRQYQPNPGNYGAPAPVGRASGQGGPPGGSGPAQSGQGQQGSRPQGSGQQGQSHQGQGQGQGQGRAPQSQRRGPQGPDAGNSRAAAPSSGLMTSLAAATGLLGIAGFVLGFFEALTVVTPGGEIDAGKTIIVAGSIPILLLAAGLIALGTMIRSSVAAGVWLVSSAVSLATAVGAGAVIYLYNSGKYTTAVPDVAGPQYEVQLSLFASVGVAILMFVVGVVGSLAAAKAARADLDAAVSKAASAASAEILERAVSAAVEAARSTATTTANSAVGARIMDLQRSSMARPEQTWGHSSSAGAGPIAATQAAPSGSAVPSGPPAPARSAVPAAVAAPQYGTNNPKTDGPDSEEVTQMTRLPSAAQLRAADDNSVGRTSGDPQRPPAKASAPVDTPRWQPSEQTPQPAPDAGPQVHSQQMDEPTMRYRARPLAEPESYVWPIQQQPIAVDPPDQNPTYSENPEYADGSGEEATQISQVPSPHEWNLQPPQYPPAPQDTARYAATWDDTEAASVDHPGERPERQWPSIPRAE